MITMLSSIAQEEARNISENVTWGHRKRFEDGKVSIAYGRFLGFERGDDGNPVIIEEEAETVRKIYRWFMEGKTPFTICRMLEELEIKSPAGKETWPRSTVLSILTNEKYKGDALLQKKFTVDFLTKKTKKNEGEVPQYYVEGSHPAIIPPVEWEAVQAEIARRKGIGKAYSGASVFSSRLVCADCGEFFGQKVWHSTDAYRKEIWRCNHKFDGEKQCSTPHLIDKQSGKSFDRPAYKRLMKRLRAGDLLVVKSIDRLGRNYDEILDQWRVITKMKRADIYVMDFPLLDTRKKDNDLTGTFIADLVLQILSYVAQTEREFIHQRQAEGIEAAKKRGVRFGRARLPLPGGFENAKQRHLSGELTIRNAAELCNMKPSTFYYYCRQNDC